VQAYFQPVSLLEQAFALTALFFHTGALTCFVGPDNPLSIFKEISAYIGFAITLGLLAANLKDCASTLSRDLLLWALVLLALASPLWSDYLPETVQNIIPLLRVTLFGVYFATRYSLRQQVQMVALVLGVSAAASLVLAVALPFYGVMGHGLITNMEQVMHQGVWRGAFIHRTMLGVMMVLCILSSLFCVLQHYRQRFIVLLGLGLATFLLMMSMAKAAPVILVLVLALIPFFKAVRWNDAIAIPFFTTAVVILGITLVLTITNYEFLLQSLGRDPTFTGRTNYWPLMLDKLWERPWFGYGYNAFWIGGWKGEVADIWRYLRPGDEPPHPHNGFLFMWFNIGLVGLSVFAAHWLSVFWRSLQWLRQVPTLEGFVPIVYFTLILFLNFTETLLMFPDILWLLYVSFSLSMSKWGTREVAWNPEPELG
jgi:O-antigen ligase